MFLFIFDCHILWFFLLCLFVLSDPEIQIQAFVIDPELLTDIWHLLASYVTSWHCLELPFLPTWIFLGSLWLEIPESQFLRTCTVLVLQLHPYKFHTVPKFPRSVLWYVLSNFSHCSILPARILRKELDIWKVIRYNKRVILLISIYYISTFSLVFFRALRYCICWFCLLPFVSRVFIQYF